MNKTQIRFLVIYTIMGGVIGSVFYLLDINAVFSLKDIYDGVGKYILFGGLAGFVGCIVIIMITYAYPRLELEEVKVSIPEFSEFTFAVNAEYRKVAWHLFIETITRIATQPLGESEGFLREALDSLYSLFQTTRKLLKDMRPTIVLGNETTVEMLAVLMLNKELRPFLAKWHPLLSEYQKDHKNELDHGWDQADDFRRELSVLREGLTHYSKAFGEIANVSHLEKYFVK